MSNHPDPYDLNYPLIYFDSQSQPWTLSNAVEGVSIWGATGSGKSSGSGRNLAKAFLKAGYGGLVLTAKSDEKATWVQYARECGREEDLILFSEEHPFRFNPIDFELNYDGRGGGQVRNVVQLFLNLYQLSESGGKSQRGEDRFWDSAMKRLLMRLTSLLQLAQEPLTIDNLYQVIASALQHPGQWQDDTIVAGSYCISCLEKAHEKDGESPEYRLVEQYWSKEYPNLDEKTRSIIKESLLGIFEPFMTGILRELFMTTTNVTPEVTQKGKIIIMDMPVQHYLELGVLAQGIMKYTWQKSIERRDIKTSPIPNFLWIDEAQLFLTEKHDMMFQTTARSSKVCTVLLSQNISNFYAVLGGATAKEQTDSLLGNLNTRIFHANSDHVTNEWASNSIGKDFTLISSFQTQMAQDGSSTTGAYQLHHIVQPLAFTTLRTGGPKNNFIVDAIVSVTGRTWKDGKNYLKLSFDQKA